MDTRQKLSAKELKEIARDLRIDCLKMLTAAGNGHPGGSLSIVDLLTVLYFEVLRHDPKQPRSDDRERFVLSKGHGVPALYAVMAKMGYFPQSDLMTLRKLGSPLQGHPDRARLPGIEASTGSLGQGLSVAQGIAMAQRLKGSKDHFTYCLVGDGEVQEGQVWEAAMSAPMHKLDRLCLIVDCNNGQIDGHVEQVMNIEPLPEKFAAFGWNVKEIDGHSIEAVQEAFAWAKSNAGSGKPAVIVARTVKGKGVSFMEGNIGWHGVSPNQEQCDQAVAELQALTFA